MTPQPGLQPGMDVSVPIVQIHLTEEQFGELLAGPAESHASDCAPAEAHLLACEQCAAELVSLRESISLFRHASSAYAENELRGLPRIAVPSRRISSPTPTLDPVWWVAAAAVFLIALLPMQFARQHIRQLPARASAVAVSNPAESDEALLTDIDRETSASIPAPMQALADPTVSVSSTSITASTPSSSQRNH